MKLITAEVVNGQIMLPPGTAEDGTLVTLLIPEPHDTSFELNGWEKATLLKSIEQAQDAEMVDGWDLLEELRPE